ncbi:hypothetical protein P692DRAFT_20640845, partial [Suillus brevipes Sb2]
QNYDGELNFATDAWTSPNHRAFMAISVHLEHEGQPLAMILDIVEVSKSHTGANLAEAFAKVLEEFGISDKVKRDEELDELTGDTELKDLQTRVEDPNKDTENDDDDDRWVDEETLLDHEEHLEL